MASIVEKIQKMWNPPEDEYDEYYEDEQYTEEDNKPEPQAVSSYKETSSASAPSLFKRSPKVVNMNNKAHLQVVVFKPMSFSDDTRDIANSLLDGHAIVLNLENTLKEESRRILDFLSGVAYAQDGKIQRIATGTFIITPANVEISGEDIFDEFENNGIYF